MGYHLCYGSPADEHLVMPRDMAIMVAMANDVRQALARRIDFLHMPVPKDRTDADYFKPLAGLTSSAGTTVYLGLINHHDTRGGPPARAAGAPAPVAPARAALPVSAVASQCGWARTDPQRLPGLLESHRQGATS